MYSFDCDDAASLAEFWSGVLERPVDEGATPAYATIGFDDEGPTWMFVRSANLPAGRNRLLLDLGGETGNSKRTESSRWARRAWPTTRWTASAGWSSATRRATRFESSPRGRCGLSS